MGALTGVFRVGVLFAALGAMSAHAQSADHPSCGPWKGKWASVSRGADLVAMDGVIALIPGVCPALQADAATRRAAAAKESVAAKAEAASARAEAARRQEAIETARREEEARAQAAETRRLEAIEAARRANDPCLQARSDWNHAQNGSEAALSAYIGGLPAACGTFRAQAQDKLDKLIADRLVVEGQQRAAAQAAEQRRIAAQQAAAQFAAITTAAKATGIEGKWKDPINVTGSRKSFLDSRCYLGQQIVVANGQLSMGGYPSPIAKVSSNTISTDSAIFTVEGDNMRKRFLASGEEFIFWRCP